MKSLLSGAASGRKEGKRDRIALSAAMAGMILFSRERQLADFPNPERRGCPSPETLRMPIMSGTLPSDELRAHLMACSECFRSYRAALAAHRMQAEVLAAPRWKNSLESLLSFGGRWGWAAAASLILLMLTGGQWMYRPQTPPREQGRAAHPVAEEGAAAPAAAETAQWGEPPPPATEQRPAVDKRPAAEKRPAEEKLLQAKSASRLDERVNADSVEAHVSPPSTKVETREAPPAHTMADTDPQPPPVAPTPDPTPFCKGCGNEPPEAPTHSAPY